MADDHAHRFGSVAIPIGHFSLGAADGVERNSGSRVRVSAQRAIVSAQDCPPVVLARCVRPQKTLLEGSGMEEHQLHRLTHEDRIGMWPAWLGWCCSSLLQAPSLSGVPPNSRLSISCAPSSPPALQQPETPYRCVKGCETDGIEDTHFNDIQAISATDVIAQGLDSRPGSDTPLKAVTIADYAVSSRARIRASGSSSTLAMASTRACT